MSDRFKYPSMSQIAAIWPGPQVLLGRNLYWTEKRDGSQLQIWADKETGEVHIATRNMDIASDQFQEYLKATPQWQAIVDLVTNEGAVEGVSDFGPYILFGELLVKGKSPARYEMHDEHEFVAFDLVERDTGTWVPVPAAYQHCLHYGVPFVEVYGESVSATMQELYAFRDRMMKLADEKGREGIVVKGLLGGHPLYAKEKFDVLPVTERDISKSGVQLPALPDTEVTGAVAKAHADLGEAFFDKAQGMPLVARYVGEECSKHMCGKPELALFTYYTMYIEGLGGK